MSSNRMLLKLSAVAIGLALAMPARAHAQQPTRKRATSQTRIKVQKEPKVNQDSANAAMERARQDSVSRMEQMRRDSIAAAAAAAERARQDSINRVEQMRRDSIARVEQMRRDSIARAEQMRLDSIARADSIAKARALQGTGWYAGVGAGGSFPLGDARDAYNNGFNIFVPVGYDWADSPFGVRIDGAYDKWTSKSTTGTGGVYGTVEDLKLYSINADLKVRYPLTTGTPHLNVYGLVGGGYHHIDFGGSDATENKIGWNAGGGMSLGWGRTSVFAESRYFSASVDGGTLKWVPVVAGVTFHF